MMKDDLNLIAVFVLDLFQLRIKLATRRTLVVAVLFEHDGRTDFDILAWSAPQNFPPVDSVPDWRRRPACSHSRKLSLNYLRRPSLSERPKTNRPPPPARR